MMLRKSTILFLIMVFFTFGTHARSLADGKLDEECARCHPLIFQQWQNSGHANSLKSLLKAQNADWTCLKCHSVDYKRIRELVKSTVWRSESDMPTHRSATNAVSCSVCHRPDSEIENNLVKPVDELCATCHVLFCGG